MQTQKKELETGLLSVDLGNFRIGDQETTRDAYHAMILEEGEDIANLADDIIKLGLSPAELFIVCPDPDKKGHFVVCEGNRRMTAIRLLENPALASGTSVHSRFVALAKQYALKPLKRVSCVVMDDKESAFVWIERKHRDLGGRGVAQWGATATGRADAFRGKIRASRAVLDHLRARRLLPGTLEASLSRQTTNLDRVFQMPYLASALGVKIEKDGTITYDNGDQKRGDDLLLRMVKRMAVAGFTVDKIRHLSDRKDFIDEFADHAVLAEPTEEPPPSGTAKHKTTKATKAKRRAASPLERTTLALRGREFTLVISEPRLNALYEEALHLNPDNLPNSAAILTRVFLELSTDHYLTKAKAALPKAHVDKGRRYWSDIGISLKEKISVALKLLDPAGNDPSLKEVRKALSTSDALHSVQALHDFIHHIKSDPDPKEVKRIWARWHPYLSLLFDTLQTLKK